MKNRKLLSLLLPLAMACCFTAQAQVKHKAKPAATHKVNLAVQIAAGKIVFSNICVACHMADGAGVQNVNPPLIKTTYVLGDKTKLITIVLNGLADEIQVNGDTYSNVMPAHDYMKDQEIADVLTYVRNSFGNKAPAVSVAEVKKVRAAVTKKA